MAEYNVKSLKAEEFISDSEILETIKYAEENKNNINESVPEDADVQHRSFTKDCLNIKQLNISEKHKGLKL